MDARFGVDVVHMGLERVVRDEQLVLHLGIVVPLREKGEHVFLARREATPLRQVVKPLEEQPAGAFDL